MKRGGQFAFEFFETVQHALLGIGSLGGGIVVPSFVHLGLLVGEFLQPLGKVLQVQLAVSYLFVPHNAVKLLGFLQELLAHIQMKGNGEP